MNSSIHYLDKRRQFIIPGEESEALLFAKRHFINSAKHNISDHGYFSVALSGGSTPYKLYKSLSKDTNALDWSKVWLFWSDERSVPSDNHESNYKMAMDAGLRNLPIPAGQIFRMHAEKNIEDNAALYEKIIQSKIPQSHLDLVMLGIGTDGHTASLFPNTKAVNSQKLVTANYVPKLQSWRMTMTFKAINNASQAVIYAFGNDKSEIVKEVFDNAEFPIQKVGTIQKPALWILDSSSAKLL